MNAWDQRAGVAEAPAVTSSRNAFVVHGMAALADHHFRATFDSNGQAVRLAGPGGFWNATLVKGSFAGLIGQGLRLMGRPSGLVSVVQRGKFSVTAPTKTAYNPKAATAPGKDGLFLNLKDARRILVIEGREVAVLRFDRKISQPLLFAFRALFEGRDFKFCHPGLNLMPSNLEGDNDGTGQEDCEQDQPPASVGAESEPRSDR